MISCDRKKILKRYQTLFQKHGYHARALGWNDSRPALRYQILSEHWDLDRARILDFGCGFGDLYGHLKKAGIRAEYHGVDLNPDLIAQGKKVYPKAHLEARDIFRQGLPKKYDYILSSGAHNLKLKDNAGFIRETFEVFDRYAQKGFALNFLSDRVDYRLPHTHHADPMKILKLAYLYSRRVILRNDYMPFEFTIFVDKRTSFDPKYPVFTEYAPDKKFFKRTR